MSKGRIITVVIAAVVVIAVAGALVLRNRLDGIVARAIENHGTRLTGTSVTVASVELELRRGRATINGLRVANPEGFSDHAAMSLGRLVLDLDPGSLTSEPYVIEDLEIRDVAARYELDQRGRRNLDVIRSSLEDAGGREQPTTEGTAAPPLLVVQRLHLSGGRVDADASALGLEARGADLPGFTLEDLGTPDGAPATEIGKQALEQLIEQAARAVLDDELKSRLQDVLQDELGEDLGEAVEDKIGDLLGK